MARVRNIPKTRRYNYSTHTNTKTKNHRAKIRATYEKMGLECEKMSIKNRKTKCQK
jgi:hypothetical protein